MVWVLVARVTMVTMVTMETSVIHRLLEESGVASVAHSLSR